MEQLRIEYAKMQIFENACILYGKELQRFIYTLTRNDPYAMEEIYQNTMLGALLGLKYLRDCTKIKIWLFSIAKAESKRYYAANRPEKCSCGRKTCEKQGGAVFPVDFTRCVEDREYVAVLFSCLTDSERQLCILHYYYDMSLKEISDVLNVNYNTVRSMRIRGMNKMRKLLKQFKE